MLPAPANLGGVGGATCADFKRSGGVAAEGGTGRPAMVVAGARRLAPASPDSFTAAAAVSEDGTSVTCPMPANAKLGYARLAVVADRTFTTVPYEFTEEALECGGTINDDNNNATSNATTAAAVGVALPKALADVLAATNASGGYTIGLWALPTADAPGVVLRVSAGFCSRAGTRLTHPSTHRKPSGFQFV